MQKMEKKSEKPNSIPQQLRTDSKRYSIYALGLDSDLARRVSYSKTATNEVCYLIGEKIIFPCQKRCVILQKQKEACFPMRILTQPIKHSELSALLPGYFGDMIKAVVDVRQGIMGINAELHADIEKELLTQGAMQADLWGINLYPELDGEDFIEFDSLINIRPYQGNRSRDVQDPAVRKQIVDVVNRLIQ